jgi:hypothetical protein
MTDYYVDTSALIKRHVLETGTVWFQALADNSAGNLIITARVSMIETYSALNRRVREARLDWADYTRAANDFAALCDSEYELIELTPDVVECAKQLLERHPLRAYDAVQLASALVVNDELQTIGLPALIFLSADDRLLSAAQAEGLATNNPNQHP